MSSNHQIILGSKSPRRKELLKLVVEPFAVESLETDERFPDDLDPKNVALYIAKQKAEAHGPLEKNQLLITADTTVIASEGVLAKPAHEEEAFAMLKRLAGRSHVVNTAVCLSQKDERKSISVYTEVFFPVLTSQEIRDYIQTFKPYDKAGAYGIQECTANVKKLLSTEERDLLEARGQLNNYLTGRKAGLKSVFIIPKIRGSYFNVVGLPIVSLAQCLKPILV